MAKSTRSPLPGRVATLAENWSAVSNCSSSAESWTSPQVPRVLTLVSTRFRSPTPAASVCISPKPRCTCSSRSLTSLNDSPRRCSSVACSFSSTVRRISSSLLALSAWIAVSRPSTVNLRRSKRSSRPSEKRFSSRAKASSRSACKVPNWPTCVVTAWLNRLADCARSSRSRKASSASSRRPRASSSRSSRSRRISPLSWASCKARKRSSSSLRRFPRINTATCSRMTTTMPATRASPIVSLIIGSLQREIGTAGLAPAILVLVACLDLRRPQENPLRRHLALLDQPGLDHLRPPRRQCLQVVVSGREVGQHQLFHFLDRQVLLQANHVARFRELRLFVGPGQVELGFLGSDFNVVERLAFAGLLQILQLLGLHRPCDGGALDAFLVGFRIGPAGDFQLQRIALVQRLGQGLQLLAGRLVDRRIAGDELDVGQLVAAAEQGTEQCERRGHRLDEQVDDDLDDQAADRELRVIKRTGNRQVQVDLAAVVLEQRNGQVDRQFGRMGALDLIPESELVDEKAILGRQLVVLQFVGDIQRQLALLDRVTGVFARIRRETDHIHAGNVGLEVEIGIVSQRIQLGQKDRKSVV